MPFHAATANMAALLRSARLLKISPSGLRHITGTKRNGAPLSRLYSGAPGFSRTGACHRLICPANASISRVWPYTVGCVRGYSVAADKKDEVSSAVQSQQAQQFEWALAKLDSSVRRTGRITKTLLLRFFHDICRTGYPTGNQALLLLRSCGSLLPEVPMEERTMLAHRVWEKLQKMGAVFDVSHYNALLKVYLQNEFKFSPTDFLAKMEAANVQPNRVTYQRLIAAYCQDGDIEGASTILGFMKSKDLPITEAVFNSLVTGHARAGDIDSAKSVLSVMQGAGIEPGPDTYVSLLSAYAEKGDVDGMKKTMEEVERADCSLMDRDIMQVISALARAGHHQHVPEMVERLRQERGYVPDAMNLCLSLITQGQEDTAFLILKTFSVGESDSSQNDSPTLGNFFLRHCVNMDTAVEKISSYCKELQESQRHNTPLIFSLRCALEANKIGMSLELMKLLKEQNVPIRPHYFLPLLKEIVKDRNTAGMLEVLKGMHELGVSPDAESLSQYILPFYPNLEASRQALMDAGISLDSVNLLTFEVRALAVGNLAKLYTLLSDPSVSSLDHNSFRGSLIQGFRKCDDVENMVKLTELLYKDERFANENSSPAEGAAFFLYHLFDAMTQQEVQACEDVLRKYLNQLHTRNIIIPINIFKGIRNLLESYRVPELIKDVVTLVDPKERVYTGSLSASQNRNGIEKKMADLKAENKPFSITLKQTIHALCAEENLQRALELKQQHEDQMTVSSYAILINQCCRHDNMEEALHLKRELSRMDPSAVLDASKYIALIKALAKNGRVEEAVDILKEMKEKDVVLDDSHVSLLFFALNSLVPNGGAPIIQRLQDAIFTLGLSPPSANLCSPLISAYMESQDLSGALEAVLECQRRYKQLPRIHDVLVGLVEKGETELLQKAMDSVSQERGEMNMLYDLFFAFLQTGRFREARKIIETPGLRSRPGRLQWYAEKCIFSNQMEALEQMVDLTAKLFECDRDEMYSYILRLCKETNNWEKAEAVWMKMQEENVIPRERTLLILADILKNNGRKVPFEMPTTWYEQPATIQQATEATTPATTEHEYRTRLWALCKKGDVREAYAVLQKANEAGVTVGPSHYDLLIRAFLSVGNITDAMKVKDIAVSHVPGFQLNTIANSLFIITYCKKGQAKDALEKLKSVVQMGQVPTQLAIVRLTQALGSHGDLEGINEVESALKDLGSTLNLSRMLFVNNKALAHINNNDLDLAADLLESVFTSPDSVRQSISYVFRKLMQDGNDAAIDKLSAMAERLANHFACYGPATDLFLELLENDKVEDAKFMLARFNALAEQKDALMSYLTRKAQIPGQVGKIKTLLSLIPDFTTKDVSYPYLMKCHVLDKDLASAKALYDQMQAEGIVVDELSLKRLARLYHNAGKEAPFPEPPESFKFYADKLKDRAAKAQTAAEE
ncbi:leucine-rich PPR motif-containing protein, mitochondrial [Solea solea]|uniref:leucine-rich PPR motif-containing protein, mitochondrial n=1 Tax=Solea solea TaxID=90069 RepID=UPI0027297A1D|nr:leucine-rich PPR motif-containing protein, mitochondrial [Solea solea]